MLAFISFMMMKQNSEYVLCSTYVNVVSLNNVNSETTLVSLVLKIDVQPM